MLALYTMKKEMHKRFKEERDLSQEIVELMSVGITEMQARQTLKAFQDLQTAISIASFYTGDSDKRTHYENYEGYLCSVKAAMEDHNASKSLHQQEIEERDKWAAVIYLKEGRV